MAPTPGRITRHNYTLVKERLEQWKEELGDDGFSKSATEYFGYPLQAHHCICCSVMQEHSNGKLGKLSIKSGYNINNGDN